MLICQQNAEFDQSSSDQQDHDWSLAAEAYPDLQEMPSFVAQQRQQYVSPPVSTSADPCRLQGKQLVAYNVVREHYEQSKSCSETSEPLKMIVSGTAGTGKSYLINCLKQLFDDNQLLQVRQRSLWMATHSTRCSVYRSRGTSSADACKASSRWCLV